MTATYDERNPLQRAVSYYAAQGFYLLPVEARSKAAAIRNWQRDSKILADADWLADWWQQHPTANLALPAGLNGVIVLDLDRHNRGRPDKPDCPPDCPSNGIDWLAAATAEHGEGWLDNVPRIQSPTGGTALFFVAPPDTDFNGSAGKLAPHVDTRAGNSYYLLPPSIHPLGGEYRWAEGAPTISMVGNGAPYLPPWIFSRLVADRQRPTPRLPLAAERLARDDKPTDYCPAWLLKLVHEGAPAGRRNDAGCVVACLLLEEVRDGHARARLMQEWARSCQPPADLRRAEAMLAWAEGKTRYAPRRLQHPPRPRYEVQTEPALFNVKSSSNGQSDVEQFNVKTAGNSVSDVEQFNVKPVSNSVSDIEQFNVKPVSNNLLEFGQFNVESADNNVLGVDVFDVKSVGGDGVVRVCPANEKLTDVGNAHRLVYLFGNRLLTVPGWGWMVWRGTHWQRDEHLYALYLAQHTAASIFAEASLVRLGGSEQERKEAEVRRSAIIRWAYNSESKGRLQAMVDVAASNPQIQAEVDDFDTHHLLLNCTNGTLDLSNGELRSHRETERLTRRLPIAYDPAAQCPTWLAFLDTVMGGNQRLITYWQRVFGYILTGYTSEQCFFVLYGNGRNGKTTLLDVALALAGHYGRQADPETFMHKDRVSGSAASPDVARLAGVRLVCTTEIGQGRRLNEPLTKQLTGGDPITARFLHRDPFTFKPNFKLFMATNYKPNIRGTDEGIWRRVRLIPFEVQIANPDKQMAEKLKAELPGILAWAVEGTRLWLHDGGLQDPPEVLAATATYRAEMDELADFLGECVLVGEGLRCTYGAMKQAYFRWCEESKLRPLKPKELDKQLELRGYRRGKGSGNVAVWLGLGLLDGGAGVEGDLTLNPAVGADV